MRPHVEKMITLGKRGDVAARRQAASYLMTREAVSKLFDTISPRYGDREGGYLRIVHGGFRKGDGGDIALVELLGSEKTLDEKRQKRAEIRAKRAEETRKAMESAEAENPPPAAEEPAAAKRRKSSGDKQVSATQIKAHPFPDALFSFALESSRLRSAVHPVRRGSQLNHCSEFLLVE